ncbi:MAG: helix-turn-helix domain-containing protein [Christensenellales bacterium]
MNKFGEFLYELRKEKGLTQQELADKLNITNKAVSKWETGDAFPETAQLKPLARILGVSVDELLEGKRNGNAVSAGAEETRPEMKPMTTGEAIITALSVAIMIVGVLLVIIWKAKGLPFMFIAVATGVFMLCMMGMRHKLKSAELTEDVYKKGIIIAALISIGVAIAILSVISIITFDNIVIFFVIIIVAVFFLITGGIMWSNFDKTYKLPYESDAPKSKRINIINETLCGVIMLLATITFLIMGLGFGKWHPGWIAFPVGGVMCGIVSTILKGFFDK